MIENQIHGSEGLLQLRTRFRFHQRLRTSPALDTWKILTMTNDELKDQLRRLLVREIESDEIESGFKLSWVDANAAVEWRIEQLRKLNWETFFDVRSGHYFWLKHSSNLHRNNRV